jgi:predicted transposase YbfD/YdcC
MTTHDYLSIYCGTAGQMAGGTGEHCEIEDGLQWVLDVVFGEDDNRVRVGHAGANLAMIRKVTVALLGRATDTGSTVTKRHKAGWDDEFPLKVLRGIQDDEVR